MKTILFLDSVHPKVEAGLRNMGFNVLHDYTSSKSEILQKLKSIDGLIIRSRFSIDADFLAKAKGLKFIARYGAGLENIDVAAAQANNIHCIRVPEGNMDAVAEQAIGMLLMLFNNLKRADSEVRNGIWKREENRGYELSGKTVGIIGYGFMGQAMAQKLSGFGCSILVYDKYKTNYAQLPVKESTLQDLFDHCDILSLHLPQTPESVGMVNAAFLAQFKKPIYLINTARGTLVNTHDLLLSLKSGKVKGACLDVLEYEKSSFENVFENNKAPQAFKDLIAQENVVLSPHIAGWSFESYEKLADFTLEKIKALYA